MITKVCRSCQQEKSASEFPKGRDSNGLYYVCKQCKVEHSQQLYRSKDSHTRWIDATFSDTKGRAKRRNIPFTITKYDLKQLFKQQENKCAYCGLLFDMNGTRTDHRKSPSVDRVFPEEGYVQTNIVLSCYRCNAIKQDATLDEIKVLVESLENIIHRKTGNLLP